MDRTTVRQKYLDCLITNWLAVNLSRDLLIQDRAPRNFITDLCEFDGQEYYMALYNSENTKHRDSNYRHLTARYIIVNANHVAFTRLEEVLPADKVRATDFAQGFEKDE